MLGLDTLICFAVSHTSIIIVTGRNWSFCSFCINAILRFVNEGLEQGFDMEVNNFCFVKCKRGSVEIQIFLLSKFQKKGVITSLQYLILQKKEMRRRSN